VPPEAASVHQAVVQESCSVCHDPHASQNPNVLVAAGNELCFGCHQEIESAVRGSEFQHAPVARDCLTCHDPHASTEEAFLLKEQTGALCSECHDPGRASFVERHMGYPVAESRCTSCHNPHGSSRPGILLAEVHQPLANKMCNQCHPAASSAAALQPKKTGVALCQGCHSGLVNETLARNRLHWPVAGAEACLSCHNPHASKEKGLLAEPAKQLCGECHPEVIEAVETSQGSHTPVAEGECSACHAPHASDHLFLMQKASSVELCADCHDWQSHSSHPIGPEVVDQRNPNLTVDCLSCHRSHGSPFKALSHLDPDGDLCVQCHQELAR
jgi:predicted CXXCH cytochrome family protein